MQYSNDSRLRSQILKRCKKASFALFTATALLSGTVQIPLAANALTATTIRQQGWDANLYLARMDATKQLIMQLDVDDKPATSYANAVYMIFAKRGYNWVQVYTSTGARLISNSGDRVTLAPEVINLSDIQRQLGDQVDLSKVELKAVAMLRYDVRGGQRDQVLNCEKIVRYSDISQTQTIEIARSEFSSSTSTTTSTTSSSSTSSTSSSTSYRREQSGFSLAILPNRTKLSQVIARISVKQKQPNGFLPEKFLGDYRYKLKGKKEIARFIKGLRPSDRVVVRLFDHKNRFIGYSEFELQAVNTAVSLILPQGEPNGIIRTVYGVDSDDDYNIDRTARVYDYFTQVTQSSSYETSQVSFFSNVRSLSYRLFDVAGLPAPAVNCDYPSSFTTGFFSIVNRTVWAFSDQLATALISAPGQTVNITDISSTSISTYEATQMISTYQSVGVTQGSVITRIDDEDVRYGKHKKPKKQHCNQGIGNGSEGCDPGNSHPHGGSNDEGDWHGGGKHGRDR